MSPQDKHIPARRANAPIEITAYSGKFDTEGKAVPLADWAAFCAYLRKRLTTTARIKDSLPLIGPHKLREGGSRNLDGVELVTLGAIDIDKNIPDVETLLREIRDLGWAAVVHASPRDPQPDTRKLRAYFPLSRPCLPHECGLLRRVIGAMLGVTIDEQALDASRFLYVGAVRGTPAREVWEIEGEPLPVDDMLAIELADAPSAPRAKPSASADAAPGDRVARVIGVVYRHYAAGERHDLTRALGSWLATRGVWGFDDAEIRTVFEALPSDQTPKRVRDALAAAARARAGQEITVGWDRLSARLGADDTARIQRAAVSDFEMRCEATWARGLARRADRRQAKRENDNDSEATWPTPAADNAPSVPLILRSKRGQVLTLLWEGDALGHRPLAEKNLRLRIKELGYHHSMIPLHDAKSGKPYPPERLVEDHGATYTHTAYAFANRVTIYDPTGEGCVVIGYPLAAMPGRFDADADAWLRALAGDHYDRLAVWIASCSQVNINRLSACLILMGRADSGKSLLGQAVARMWGQAPPALGLVTAQFNADLLRCPILVDEEAQLLGSKELSTKKFRDVIQSSARSVEFKGLERSELHGGLRAVVSCNGYSDLRFKDLGGPAVIEALRDRMLVINATERTDACKAPLARLRPDQNDHRVDLERVAAHLAWLCETVALPAERFLGAGGDETEAAILSSLTEEHAELWETFRDWLETDGPGGAWSAHVGQLCANPGALATLLERAGRGWDLPRVRGALAPFVKTRDYQPRDGGARPRLWVLDGERVAESLGLGAEPRVGLTAKLDASQRPAQPRKKGRFGSAC